jgi:hypothetical protein
VVDDKSLPAWCEEETKRRWSWSGMGGHEWQGGWGGIAIEGGEEAQHSVVTLELSVYNTPVTVITVTDVTVTDISPRPTEYENNDE